MTQRATGPVIRTHTLYTETWGRLGGSYDPRLDQDCLVFDAGVGWWLPLGTGHTHNQDEAKVYTPRPLFEKYGDFSPEDTSEFHFLYPLPPVPELPPAEFVYGLSEARMFLVAHPERYFLIQGMNSKAWGKREILLGEAFDPAHSTINRNEAGLFVGMEIMHRRFEQLRIYYEILPKDFKPPPPPKIRIERILTGSMIAALRELPTNPTIRTQIWSIIKSPIPEDKRTFDEIKAWIEENYDPKPSGLFRKPSPEQPGVGLDGFLILCSVRQRVHGTCNFSATQAGSSEYTVTRNMLEAAVAKAQGRANPEEAFLEAMENELREAVNENEPDMSFENEETYDHDIGNTEHRDLSYPGLYEQSRAWLQRYHPDLAQPEQSAMGLEEDEPEDDDEDP